jgi:hypothetical protein
MILPDYGPVAWIGPAMPNKVPPNLSKSQILADPVAMAKLSQYVKTRDALDQNYASEDYSHHRMPLFGNTAVDYHKLLLRAMLTGEDPRLLMQSSLKAYTPGVADQMMKYLQ